MEEPHRLERPTPSPSDLTRPYWDAAAHGRLAVQHCESCRRFVHPPRPQCPTCGGVALGFAGVSGLGVIETLTVVHRTFAPGFTDRVPYTLAWVELAEQTGLRILCNPVGEVRIGMAVEVVFEDLEGFGAIPQFRRAESERPSSTHETKAE